MTFIRGGSSQAHFSRLANDMKASYTNQKEKAFLNEYYFDSILKVQNALFEFIRLYNINRE